MPISLTCECGKKLAVKEDMAGKKVKCPACGTVLTVPSVNEPAAATQDDGLDEAPAPKKKRNGAGGQKSNKMMWIIGGIAGVLLLGCGCCGVGVGAWFFFLRSSVDPEKAIVGRWQLDVDAMKKASTDGKLPAELELIASMEVAKFDADGKEKDGPLTPYSAGKWEKVSVKGDSMTIKVVNAGNSSQSMKFDLRFTDKDHFRIVPSDSKDAKELYLKRMS